MYKDEHFINQSDELTYFTNTVVMTVCRTKSHGCTGICTSSNDAERKDAAQTFTAEINSNTYHFGHQPLKRTDIEICFRFNSRARWSRSVNMNSQKL